MHCLVQSTGGHMVLIEHASEEFPHKANYRWIIDETQRVNSQRFRRFSKVHDRISIPSYQDRTAYFLRNLLRYGYSSYA